MKLTVFDLSNNNINNNASHNIASVLSYNTMLQVLNLDNNNLKSVGVIKIAHALHNTVTLTSIKLSNNNATTDDIAAVLSHNTNLQKLF